MTIAVSKPRPQFSPVCENKANEFPFALGPDAKEGSPANRTGDQSSLKRSFPLSTCATHCSSLIRSSWMGVLLGTGDAQEVEGFFLDVCRPWGDCEGEVGREGGRDGVFGDGGEVVKQGVEAVDGET